LQKVFGFWKIYGIISLGAFLAALGLSVFLTPVNMVAGGLSGLSILLHGFIGLPVGLLMLLLNIPLFILGYFFLGQGFLLRSAWGALLFSVLTDVLAVIPPITDNFLLCAVFGGGLLGLGMGLIFLPGATTGGTDIIAQILHKLVPVLDVGKWLLLADASVIAVSGFTTGRYEVCLYGIIAACTNSFLVDTVIQGANVAKVVYVISSESEAIAQEVMKKLARGITGLYCKKMYSQKDGVMLVCVVKRHELRRLKHIVLRHDPNAFIIFSGARAVSGEGFKIYPIN